MNFIISGKNINVTPGLKEAVESKLGKLERYFTPETEIIVTLSVEKERQKIEVTIPVKGQDKSQIPAFSDNRNCHRISLPHYTHLYYTE